VTMKEQDLRDYYKANAGLFPKPPAPPPLLTAAKPPADDPEADFAAARKDVEAAYRLDRARRLAAQTASDFVTALDDQKIKPDGLAPFLAKQSLTLRTIPPFPRDHAPAELGGDPQTTGFIVFKLDAAHPYSDALPNEHGSTVVVWRGLIPPRQPQFAEVKAQVEAAYRESEKKRLFIALGQRVHDRLAASLKAGTPFAKALADATAGEGAVKAEAKDYPAMTLRQHSADQAAGKNSDVLLERAIPELQSLNQGQVADMITLTAGDEQKPDKGLLIYAAEKKVPDLTPANPEYAVAQAALDEKFAAFTGDNALSEFVEGELARSAGPAAAQP
jgi:peptidyl-prolyl cis-trans isomerase D